LRAAIRLATALAGAADAQPVGRLCIARIGRPSAEAGGAPEGVESTPADTAARRAAVVNAARYLAPVVLDLAADGSATGVAPIADRVAIVSAATGEPALLDAVVNVIGGQPVRVVTRVGDEGEWAKRADVLLPDSRIGARAAALGTRALGSMGAGIARIVDALEEQR
jgi:hypothetical protein